MKTIGSIKSVVLAAVVGLTVTTAGFVTSPTPAEAQDGYHMCYINDTHRAEDRWIYFKTEWDCADHHYTLSEGTQTGRSPVESNCEAFTEWKEMEHWVDDICEKISHVEHKDLLEDYHPYVGFYNTYTEDLLQGTAERASES